MKRTKQILSVFLALIMVISTISMSTITAGAEESATSGTCGENLTWNFDELTGTLTIEGTGEMYDYDYNSNRPWESFCYNNNIKSLKIGDDVTAIGDCAFYACDSLTSVEMGDSLTKIGFSAFYFCTALTNIEIPSSVISIGRNAFAECTSLIDVTIPTGVTAISGYTFYFCRALINVTIPDSVTTIGGCAFYGCESLTSITIPDSVTTIDGCAFYGCNSLTNITIGRNIKLIGEEAFCYCESLADVYYNGTEAHWSGVTIREYNDSLLNATIHFNNHTHDYEPIVTAPTCTEQGYTTYTCACGESYVDDYVDALGHTDTYLIEENYVSPTCTENGSKDVVVYCSVCDGEISRETVVIYVTSHADDNGDGVCDTCDEFIDIIVECDCNCHKSGVSKFIFDLILFFQRIFGFNKTCSCGVAHY